MKHLDTRSASSPATHSYLVAWGVGIIEGVLALRLLAKLLAARPEHAAIQLLYRVSDPLVAPLWSLDAGQPRFGAVLEYSTLVTALLILAGGYLVWLYGSRRNGRHKNQ
jgi:hypothetical protein